MGRHLNSGRIHLLWLTLFLNVKEDSVDPDPASFSIHRWSVFQRVVVTTILIFGRLTTQMAWLEKNLAACLSREERRKLVERENSELPMSTQARLLGLNRSGLFLSVGLFFGILLAVGRN